MMEKMHALVPENRVERIELAREMFAALSPADQREFIALAAALASQQVPGSDSQV